LVLFYQVADIIEHTEHYKQARLEPYLKSIQYENYLNHFYYSVNIKIYLQEL
jgi:hypothetical protein